MGFVITLGKWSRRVLKRASLILIQASAVTIGLIMLIMVYEVVSRYVFNRPTIWSMDVTQQMLIVPVFLAAAHLMLRDEHIRMDLFSRRLSTKARLIVDIVTSLMGLAGFLVFLWSASRQLQIVYTAGFSTPGALKLPLAPPYFIMVIGTALFCLAIISKIIEYSAELIRGEKKTAELPKEEKPLDVAVDGNR